MDKLRYLKKNISFSNNKMSRHIRWGILLVFIFIGLPAFSEEIGRITLDVRATEEEADNDHYWFYVYFTNTIPENEFLTKVVDGWSTIPTSGYFRKTANGFELKAKYLKDKKDAILNTWIDYDFTGGYRHGLFRYLPGALKHLYKWEYHLESDPYDWIDYWWNNRTFFENNGYYRYYEEWSIIR